MSLNQIRLTLESRLKVWADAYSPALPIAAENVNFTKPINSPFVESYLIPNSTLSRNVTASKMTYIGFLQVNIWTKKDTGTFQAEQIADSLGTMFKHGLKIGNLTITNPPSVGRPMLDSAGWIIHPVLISYRYDSN